jgi:hypothetical protein
MTAPYSPPPPGWPVRWRSSAPATRRPHFSIVFCFNHTVFTLLRVWQPLTPLRLRAGRLDGGAPLLLLVVPTFPLLDAGSCWHKPTGGNLTIIGDMANQEQDTGTKLSTVLIAMSYIFTGGVAQKKVSRLGWTRVYFRWQVFPNISQKKWWREGRLRVEFFCWL